jgi:hypothetical protein
MLAIMIERTKSDIQIEGVIHNLVDGGLSILQYADDIILFMENDIKKARNLKLIFPAFEQSLGLKINFHKSELFYFGEARANANLYVSYSAASKTNFLLSIWVSRFTIGDLRMSNGKWWRNDYKLD